MKKELFRTIKYVLIAASAGLIEIGSFTLMNELLHWNYWVSYLIALILSVLWNFTINRRYTFKSASNVPKAMLLVFAYYCVFTPLSTLLEHWLVRNEKQNKSYAYDHEVPNSKKAILRFRAIGQSERYTLLEVNLMTGRHHQIRCQLAAMGCPIKGDLKYGAPRSNPDGSISLMARRVEFIHPVSKEPIVVEAPLPHDTLWQALAPDGAKK